MGQRKLGLFRSFCVPIQDIFHDAESDDMAQNHLFLDFFCHKLGLHPNIDQAILKYQELNPPHHQQIELGRYLQFVE